MSDPKIVQLCDDYIASSRARLADMQKFRDELVCLGDTPERLEQTDRTLLLIEQGIARAMSKRKQAL